MSEERFYFNPRGSVPSQKLRDFVEQQSTLRNCKLFQSSGSTGIPKWVALSSSALEASAVATNKHLDVTAKDVFSLALPKFHVGGYGVVERSRVSGATLKVFESKWSAYPFAKWVEQERVSVGSLVAAQVYDLVKEKIVCPSSVRAIVVGGGALPHALYYDARKLNWPLLPSYGLTECASQVATAELSSLQTNNFPKAKILSHMRLEEVSELTASVQSSALFTAYLAQTEQGEMRIIPRSEPFLLPDKVKIVGSTVEVLGRREEEFKILGEFIRWDFLKKKFNDLALGSGQFMKCELAIFPDERRGNKIAILCEEFDHSAKLLVQQLNAEVFPFERVTHFMNGNLPRSELGKIQILKIKALCLQEIAG